MTIRMPAETSLEQRIERLLTRLDRDIENPPANRSMALASCELMLCAIRLRWSSREDLGSN